MSRPRFKDGLTAIVIDPRLAVLLSDLEHWTLDGPVYPRLVPLLDGTRTVSAIVERLRGDVSIAEALAAIEILDTSGFLAHGGKRRRPVRARDSTAAAVRFLAGFGVETSSRGKLTVVPTDEYLSRNLLTIAKQALQDDRAWVPLKPVGTTLWIGPLVRPPATPCWMCVLARIRANRPAHAWLESRGAFDGRREAKHLRLRHRTLSESGSPLKALSESGTMIAVHPATGRTSLHLVIRVPGCPRCAPAAVKSGTKFERDLRPVLARRERITSCDGGWRAATAAETFTRFKHHISRWTGIVSGVTRSSKGVGGPAVYSAEHLFASSASDPFPTTRQISSGKGMSNAQARASALCEALERFSGVIRHGDRRRRTTYLDLGGDAVHPNDLTLFSDAQLETRAGWNALGSPQCFVPDRLDDRQPIDWTPVWSLTNERVRYVPTGYCFYGYSAVPGEHCCQANSNGCAAGTTLEEAILQGFLELVERDAVAIWWYNELALPRVELRSFSHPFFARTIADYARVGRSLKVFDLTNDMGVPSFAAVSTHPRPASNSLLLGFGAHLDAEIAIARAITELNQWRCGVARGVAGQSFTPAHRRAGTFLAHRPAATRNRDDFPARTRIDLRAAITECVGRARRIGLETLILDQTRKDVGLPVVRVIVPGLRHFWPRFGAGRLYDVPVTMGWRRAPTLETRLNNFHLVI